MAEGQKILTDRVGGKEARQIQNSETRRSISISRVNKNTFYSEILKRGWRRGGSSFLIEMPGLTIGMSEKTQVTPKITSVS